ncbi:MAG: cupredoxin family protein [Pseudomonadota bacterium]
MKSIIAISTAVLLTTSVAYAGGSHNVGHSDDHSEKTESHGHSEGHGSDDHHGDMAAGKPGDPSKINRTVAVKMYETDDGGMLFEPKSLSVKLGETIRFEIVNAGENEHEFVLDSYEKNQEHKALMAKLPEMEHDDPNSVRLEEGQSGEIIWEFSNHGEFEFACLIPGHYESGMHGNLKVSES